MRAARVSRTSSFVRPAIAGSTKCTGRTSEIRMAPSQACDVPIQQRRRPKASFRAPPATQCKLQSRHGKVQCSPSNPREPRSRAYWTLAASVLSAFRVRVRLFAFAKVHEPQALTSTVATRRTQLVRRAPVGRALFLIRACPRLDNTAPYYALSPTL